MRSIHLPGSGLSHRAPITHVAFSPHSAELATCSYDGTAVVWGIDHAGKVEPRLRLQHRRLVNASAWNPRHAGVLATAAADKTVAIWRVDGKKANLTSLLARHTDDVNAVAWLPDGERLITVSEDSTASLWQDSGRFLGRFAAHAGHCMGVSISLHGLVLTVGEDGAVFVGGVDSLAAPRKRVFDCSVEGCSWSPDGSRAALACDDGFVRIVSPELDLLAAIHVVDTAVRGVAWATDGSNRLVAGSYDASVRVLDGNRLESTSQPGRQWPRSVDTSGSLVAVGSFGGSPVVLALDGLGVLNPGGEPTHGPNALAIARSQVLIGLDAGGVVSLPVASLAQADAAAATLTDLGESPVLALSAADSGYLAALYSGHVVRTRVEADSVSVTAELDLGAPVPSLASRPSSPIALAGTYNGDIAFIETSGFTLSLRSKKVLHHGSIKSIAWLDGDNFVTGATDGAVRVTNLEGDSAVRWLHGNLINAVAADQRGLVASASRDRLVKVETVRDGIWSQRRLLMSSDESVKAVSILGSGNDVTVVAGSYDFAVYAWQFDLDRPPDGDLRSGSIVHEFTQAVSTICRIDERRFVVASWDGTIALFEMDGAGYPRLLGSLTVNELVASARVIPLQLPESREADRV